MSLLKSRINYSLKRVINYDIAEENNISITPQLRKFGSRRKIDSFRFRKLQPVQKQQKKGIELSKNYKKIMLKRLTSLNITTNDAISPNRSPINKSPILSSLNDYKQARQSIFHTKSRKRYNTDYLTYDQILIQRQKEQDSRRLIILKQVICQNVKRKNLEMQKNSKKRMEIKF